MEKAFLEITNICNLSCSFCHGTGRTPRKMSLAEYEILTDKLTGKVRHLYFHLMGEPLLHPLLPDFIRIARGKGFIPVITTNGTLLQQSGDRLIEEKPFKVSISLQSYEANLHRETALSHGTGSLSETDRSAGAGETTPQETDTPDDAERKTDTPGDAERKTDTPGDAEAASGLRDYLSAAASFARKAAPETVVVFRLWNAGGLESENDRILAFLHEAFPGEWRKNRSGYCLSEKIFLEFGDAFDWPDAEGEAKGIGTRTPLRSPAGNVGPAIDERISPEEGRESFFCYGLRNQIGILADGTVVPCCLDAEGSVPLGNLLTEDLDTILASPRARALYDGFSMHEPVEELCKHCGYARKTMHYHGKKASPYAK